MSRFLILLIIILTVTACSIPSLDNVLSDTRTEYKKSKTLPPLDVPPDLSTTESDGTMAIPGETTTATLKDYENRTRRQNQARATSTPAASPQVNNTAAIQTSATTPVSTPAMAPVPAPVLDADGGTLITARGNKAEVWNKLRNFITGKGYQLDLDDLELGYMETHWSTPVADNGHTYRYKFKIYSEPDKQPGVTMLYVDNEQQEQVSQGGNGLVWKDRSKSADVERMLAGEMNVYFNGQQQEYQRPVSANAATAAPASAQPAVSNPAPAREGLAQIKDIGNNKILLAIPEEYTLAWRRTGEALQMAGLVIKGSDQDKGLYHITYRGTKAEDKGWTAKLKKLKFWGKNKDAGAAYQVALTGVGEKTEIVILDEDGGWADNDTAENLLSMIQTQYNKL